MHVGGKPPSFLIFSSPVPLGFFSFPFHFFHFLSISFCSIYAILKLPLQTREPKFLYIQLDFGFQIHLMVLGYIFFPDLLQTITIADLLKLVIPKTLTFLALNATLMVLICTCYTTVVSVDRECGVDFLAGILGKSCSCLPRTCKDWLCYQCKSFFT